MEYSMNYPDGQPVKIGDLVWWDGGHYVGFVNSINPPDDCTNSNFVVIGRHPFRRDYPGYALGETRFAEIEFSDEGIGLLTETERAELGRAERIALQTTETPLICLLYTSPSPRDLSTSRMPSSA